MRLRRRAGLVMRAAIAGGACLAPIAASAQVDSLRDEIEQMRVTLRGEMAALRQREQQLDAEVLRLDQRNQLLDRQLQTLRAAGPGQPAASARTDEELSARRRRRPVRRAIQEPALAAQPSESPAAAVPVEGAVGAPGQPAGQAAPITGPAPGKQAARRTLETALTLSTTGGVLTPRGQVQVDPQFGYDYTSQNQLGVNGFQIIPGITFGNIFVNRVEQNVATAGVTLRVGITDRLELNTRIPYVFNASSTTSLIPEGTNAQQLSTSAFNSNIGDIQVGASYQVNSGQNGWPIFIGNLLFKTVTGTSPYEVPIFTDNDPNGQFLRGIAKKSPTGTGFYSISPSLTVIYPTAPGTLFANVLYTNNLSSRVSLQNTSGGAPTPLDLTPGQSVGLTLGIGFALNDRASLSLSYQQQYVFTSMQDGQSIRGSAYGFGSFNFGIGYQLSERLRVNANVGIGVGPNTPAARILVEFPYFFSL